MKEDEYQFLLGNSIVSHPKRVKYILKKWHKKGWLLDGKNTAEFDRIKNLILTKEECIDKWDNHVVKLELVDEHNWLSSSIGIISDCGDNGYHFYTTSTTKKGYSFYLGDGWNNNIAYIDLYPSAKVWRRLNYFMWKKERNPDFFHHKISNFSPLTVCDYSRANEGIFTYTNPRGELPLP